MDIFYTHFTVYVITNVEQTIILNILNKISIDIMII